MFRASIVRPVRDTRCTG